MDFFHLIRYKNLLITLATLALSYYAMIDYVTLSDLLNPQFFYLASAILLTAAGGYVINDYHDVNIDNTNKPDKVIIGKTISRRKAIALHIWFNIAALIFSLFIGYSFFLLVLMAAILLWLYSTYFKKKFLSGNILVALISAMVIVSLYFVHEPVSAYLVVSYSFFAFMLSLVREIIKDTEDMRGDAKFNCKTLPIVLGIRPTKKIIQVGLIVLQLSVAVHLTIGYPYISFRHHQMQLTYLIYLVLAVCAPVAIMYWLTIGADSKADFSKLSKLAKITMVLGILSLIWLKY